MFGFWGKGSKGAEAASPPKSQRAKRVILLVEDDPSLLESMSRYLTEKERFSVLTADSYQTGLRHLEATIPHIACIDLGLPSESGYELCEYLRSQPLLLYLPVIVTGEQSSPKDMAHAEDAGANAFLPKPFTLERLGVLTNVMLEGAQLSRPGMRLLRPAKERTGGNVL